MPSTPQRMSILLAELASARSGDKGNHSNLGIVAYDHDSFEFLLQHLTAEVVHRYFQEMGVTRVERFVLPQVKAFNFLLHDALAGGASESLRLDTQGKLMGHQVMSLELPMADHGNSNR